MTHRKLVIALLASAALNLFLVGAVVGGLVIGDRLAEGRRPAGRGQPLMAAADQLSPESRQAYRRLLRGQSREVGDEMRQSRHDRREAWQKLGADPATAPQVKLDLAQARAGEVQARGQLEDRIVDFVAALPPAERATLVQGLARSGPGGRSGDIGRRPPPPPP